MQFGSDVWFENATAEQRQAYLVRLLETATQQQAEILENLKALSEFRNGENEFVDWAFDSVEPEGFGWLAIGVAGLLGYWIGHDS